MVDRLVALLARRILWARGPLILNWIKGLTCTYVGPRGIEPRTRGVNIDRCRCLRRVLDVARDLHGGRFDDGGVLGSFAVSSRRSVWVEYGWILNQSNG